jgi:hypothetical protein
MGWFSSKKTVYSRSSKKEGESTYHVEDGMGISITHQRGYDLVELRREIDEDISFNYADYVIRNTRHGVDIVADFHRFNTFSLGMTSAMMHMMKIIRPNLLSVTGPKELESIIDICYLSEVIRFHQTQEGALSPYGSSQPKVLENGDNFLAPRSNEAHDKRRNLRQ